MIKNNVALHNENGITQLKINGTEIAGISDYKITSSANGKTDLTFTISAGNIATDVEMDLAKKKNGYTVNEIDTSKEGFEFAGVKLTEQQYEDMIALNLQMQTHKNIPVFSMMMLLKILGILPPEMLNNNGDSFPEDSEQWFHHRYGKRRE